MFGGPNDGGRHGRHRAARVVVLLAGVLGALAMGAPAAAEEPPLTIHYHVRAPYVVEAHGGVAGLSAGPAVSALEAARVPYRLAQTPAARFFATIEANSGRDCGIGWFRTPAREAIGKFTRPLYRDAPMVVVASAESSRVRGTETLEALLRNGELLLLTKQSYSYGKDIDAAIERYGTRREVVSVENVAMLRMVAARRADYMFASAEEIGTMIADAGLSPEALRRWQPADMPPGEYRYLFCSRQVPDALVARIDAALARPGSR